MAFGQYTIFHDWSNAVDTQNGGGFDPANSGGFTDLACTSGDTNSPVVTSASRAFDANDVGAWIYIQAGSNWKLGWVQIASVNAGAATCSAAIGQFVLVGSTATMKNYVRPNGFSTTAGVSTVATNSGGTWFMDYSQQTSAHWAYTDIVISGTTNTDATSAAHPFTKNMVGNVISITSGTGFTVQRVQLVSIVSGVIGRFDKSLGTLSSTGGTGKFGGATGAANTVPSLTFALVAGNKVFIKGTRTLTTTTGMASGIKGDITSGRLSIEGFTTTPGQRDGRPTITSATNSVALLTLNDNDYVEFAHLNLTHTAATRGNGISSITSSSVPVVLIDCIIDGCLSAYNSALNGSWLQVENCEIKNCTSTTAAILVTNGFNLYMYGCDVHDNAGDGVRQNSNNVPTYVFSECIFDTNAIGINLAGLTNTAYNLIVRSCLFIDNTGDGIKIPNTSSTNVAIELFNNAFIDNGVYGVENLAPQTTFDANVRINRSNFFYSNTTGELFGMAHGTGDVSLTGDPYPNRASRDFTPASGVGIRAAAFPAVFPGGQVYASGTTSRDGGPVQHQDTGSATSGGYVIGA